MRLTGCPADTPTSSLNATPFFQSLTHTTFEIPSLRQSFSYLAGYLRTGWNVLLAEATSSRDRSIPD